MINDAEVLTVNEIEIKNNHSQIGTDCDIVFPLTVKVFNKGQYLIDTPKNLFEKGDFIQIFAGYEDANYERLNIFEGYIYDFVEGTPLKMRCLDYSYFLRMGLVGKPLKAFNNLPGLYYQDGTIDTVLKDILAGTGVTLMKTHISFTIQNLSFTNVSPIYALEWIKKELGICMTLIGSELYFHLAENTLNTYNLRTDTNVIKADLQKPDAAFQKWKVQINYKDISGLKKLQEIGSKEDGEIKTYNFCCVNKKHPNYMKLVDNTLNVLKLTHYTGKVTTYLYPDINLFDAVNFEDVRFKERTATYVCTGVNIKLSTSGFHRELTLAYLRE
jgi:hypothetical protein